MNLPAITQPTLFRLRKVPPGGQAPQFWFDFADPTPQRFTVESEPQAAPPAGGAREATDGVEVLVLPSVFKDDGSWRAGMRSWLAGADQPVLISAGGGEIQAWWRPGRAVIVAPVAHAAAALEAVADFAWHESELCRLEQEIAACWPELEEDAPLAYDIHRRVRARQSEIGRRVEQVCSRRMRHARLEPHLHDPPAHFSPQAREVGAGLRRGAGCKDRCEFTDSQLEVYEYVYEQASQRMGEYRHARKSDMLESAIIVLLVLEVILIVIEIYLVHIRV